MVERKCAGCGKIKNRDELIKITKQNPHGDIVINPDSKVFKKNKISRVLKASVPPDMKGKLINEF